MVWYEAWMVAKFEIYSPLIGNVFKYRVILDQNRFIQTNYFVEKAQLINWMEFQLEFNLFH